MGPSQPSPGPGGAEHRPPHSHGAGGQRVGHPMQLSPPPWLGWAELVVTLRSISARPFPAALPGWKGQGWSQNPVPCRACPSARQEWVAVLWAPWVPSLCSALHCTPRTWVCLGCWAREGAETCPPPYMKRVGSQQVSAVPFAGAPRAAGEMEKLILTQPLSSVCLCLQEPPSV